MMIKRIKKLHVVDQIFDIKAFHIMIDCQKYSLMKEDALILLELGKSFLTLM